MNGAHTFTYALSMNARAQRKQNRKSHFIHIQYSRKHSSTHIRHSTAPREFVCEFAHIRIACIYIHAHIYSIRPLSKHTSEPHTMYKVATCWMSPSDLNRSYINTHIHENCSRVPWYMYSAIHPVLSAYTQFDSLMAGVCARVPGTWRESETRNTVRYDIQVCIYSER